MAKVTPPKGMKYNPDYESIIKAEPDYLFDATHPEILCVMKRIDHLGTLNGYVGIPKHHPLYGKDYDDLFECYVHGGLTFASGNLDIPEDELEQTQQFKNYYHQEPRWWFGFDTAHSGDAWGFVRQLEDSVIGQWENDVYRTVDYVQDEIRNLKNYMLNFAGYKPKSI